MIAEITPLPGYGSGSGGEIDNSLPGLSGRPDNSLPGYPSNKPIVLPPLPGIWPPPGTPNLPVRIPIDPGYGHPIIIEGRPDNPIALPPGIYPPLPPTSNGKYAVLIYVLGVGHRWAVVDTSQIAQPK